MEVLLQIVSYVIYGALALVALWGMFCVILVWRRVEQSRFRNEGDQLLFLDELGQLVEAGRMEQAMQHCEGDRRAIAQLALLALTERDRGYQQVRRLVIDRFERQVLNDLEHRLSWVYTVIKGAPMVGLLGTVVGMMGAFAKLSSGTQVDTTQLAQDISFALITTACGLAIAIPLVFCSAGINVRIRKMEELVAAGLTQFMDVLKAQNLAASESGST